MNKFFAKILTPITLVATAVIVTTYITFFITIVTNHYTPTTGDGVVYYLSAKNFFVNTTTYSPILSNGVVARLFGGGPWGLMYTLFYGFIAKVFGWHATLIIITNFALVLLAAGVILIFLNEICLRDRVLILDLLLSNTYLILSLVKYHPEEMHLFFAAIVAVLLCKIYKRKDAWEKQEGKVLVLFYVLTLIFASFFRPTWIFFMFALIPLARTKRQLWTLTLFSFVCLLFSYAYLRLTYAPPSSAMVERTQQTFLSHGLYSLLLLIAKQVLNNVHAYFFNLGNTIYNAGIFYLLSKLLMLMLLFFMVFYGIFRRNPLFLAIAIVITITTAALFTMNDVVQWIGVQIWAPSYYVACVALVYYKKYFPALCVLLLTFLSMPSAIHRAEIMKSNSIRVATNHLGSPGKFSDFKRGILSVSKEKGMTNILTTTIHFYYYLDDFPLRNNAGYPIRYIYNSNNSLIAQGDVHYDYVLLPNNKIFSHALSRIKAPLLYTDPKFLIYGYKLALHE